MTVNKVVHGSYLTGNAIQVSSVRTMAECLQACAMACRTCVSINLSFEFHPGQVNTWTTCQLNDAVADSTANVTLTIGSSWDYYVVDSETCL